MNSILVQVTNIVNKYQFIFLLILFLPLSLIIYSHSGQSEPKSDYAITLLKTFQYFHMLLRAKAKVFPLACKVLHVVVVTTPPVHVARSSLSLLQPQWLPC